LPYCKAAGLFAADGDRARGAAHLQARAGGGGLGNAAERDPALVVADIRNGYISRASAREAYKIVVRDDVSVDVEATQALRAGE